MNLGWIALFIFFAVMIGVLAYTFNKTPKSESEKFRNSRRIK